MNADLTRLTAVYTAERGSAVAEKAPNSPEPGLQPAQAFDLIVEAAAGSVVGNSGTGYTLVLTAIDEVTGKPSPDLGVGPLVQRFDAGDGWAPDGNDYVMTQRFQVRVPAGARGHVFHYIATLVGDDCRLASFGYSDPFILV
ncbi:MAG: hypothetical protein J2P45_23020 [Candidatus Dormibacteraeota bacterium]|nr:hypothetical protein [Candidatus Dormibacteraeota bacterium]